MSFKTITIKEDAYELAKSAKKEGESFTELFRREFQDQKAKQKIDEVMKYFGAWEMTDEEYEKKLESIKEYRKEFDRDARKRMKRLGIE